MRSLILLSIFFPVLLSCKSEGKTPIAQSIVSPADTVAQDTFPRIDVDEKYLMGQFDPATHPDFTELELKHASTKGMYLRKDAYEAFKRMHDAAWEDGIRLVILSATRNFARQKYIWEAKWNGDRKTTGVKDIKQEYPEPSERALKILEYSSMPGTSRHHWGTDIDLNNLENEYFSFGEGEKLYEWMVENAHKYGYCQVYTPKGPERPHGYNEEKWHWSFIPVAKQLTDQAEEKLTNNKISGFDGDESASMIGVVDKFVLGINKECR